MREAEQLSSLTGDIYDAALKPTLWIDVLAKCAQFVGGPAAMLVSRDTAHPTRSVAYYSGFDQHFKQLVLEKYVKIESTADGSRLRQDRRTRRYHGHRSQ